MSSYSETVLEQLEALSWDWLVLIVLHRTQPGDRPVMEGLDHFDKQLLFNKKQQQQNIFVDMYAYI